MANYYLGRHRQFVKPPAMSSPPKAPGINLAAGLFPAGLRRRVAPERRVHAILIIVLLELVQLKKYICSRAG